MHLIYSFVDKTFLKDAARSKSSKNTLDNVNQSAKVRRDALDDFSEEALWHTKNKVVGLKIPFTFCPTNE